MDKYAIAAFLIGLWIMCSWVISMDKPYQKYKRLQKERRAARETDRLVQKRLKDFDFNEGKHDGRDNQHELPT